MLKEAEIKTIADSVIAPHLSGLGLDHIEVRFDRDDLDGPTLSIDAIMKPGVAAVGGKVVTAAHDALSRSLLSQGEERFPYFRVRYPDDEIAFDDGPEID